MVLKATKMINMKKVTEMVMNDHNLAHKLDIFSKVLFCFRIVEF